MKILALNTIDAAIDTLVRGLVMMLCVIMFIIGLSLRESVGEAPYFTPMEGEEVQDMADPPPGPGDELEHLALIISGAGAQYDLDATYARNPYLRL